MDTVTKSIKGDVALLRLDKLYYCHLCHALCKIRGFKFVQFMLSHFSLQTTGYNQQNLAFFFSQLLTLTPLYQVSIIFRLAQPVSQCHRFEALELGLRGSYHKILSLQLYDSKHKHTYTLSAAMHRQGLLVLYFVIAHIVEF